MDTWTLELSLKRNGREDLNNIKHISMDGLTTQMQSISLRKVTVKMVEDFISFLNNENGCVQRCEMGENE